MLTESECIELKILLMILRGDRSVESSSYSNMDQVLDRINQLTYKQDEGNEHEENKQETSG